MYGDVWHRNKYPGSDQHPYVQCTLLKHSICYDNVCLSVNLLHNLYTSVARLSLFTD